MSTLASPSVAAGPSRSPAPAWQRHLHRLVLARNAAELRPSRGVFRSYAALHEQLRRLQGVALAHDALLAEHDRLQARLRALEAVAAEVPAQTAREAALQAQKDRLQARLDAATAKETAYYRGLTELAMWRERAETAEERLATSEDALARRTSELGLVKKEYVSLREEVALLRDRLLAMGPPPPPPPPPHELDSTPWGLAAGLLEQQQLSTSSSHPQSQQMPRIGMLGRELPTRVGGRVDHAHAGTGLQAVCVPDSGNQRFFTAGADKTIGVWDLAQGKAGLAKSLQSRGLVLSLHTVSHYLLAGCADHVVRFWDINTLRSLEMAGHSEKVVSACLSATAQHAFSASSDHTLKLWDVRRREVLRTLLVESTCNDLAVINDSIVSAHYNGSLVAWDRRSATRTHELVSVHQGPATCVRISADGRLCVSLGKDNTLLMRDSRMITQTLRTVRPPQLTVASNWTRFSISAGAQFAAVGSNRGQVLLLALEQSVEDALLPGACHARGATNGVSESVLSVLEGGHEKVCTVHSVAWTAETPSRVISIGDDRRIVVWE